MTDEPALDIGRFTDLEATGEVDRFIGLLDRIERLPEFAALRRHSYDLLEAGPGARAADVGCGTGRAVAELAALGVRVTGVDASVQMIETARRRHPAADFQVGAATELPFAGGELIRYRAERLYHHLPDPSAALAEAARVLAPGGRIVLLDMAIHMGGLDATDRALNQAVIDAFSDSTANPWIGLSYRGLLHDAGFTHVTIAVRTLIHTDYADLEPLIEAMAQTAQTAGVATRDQLDGWLQDLRTRSEQGRFLSASPAFLAAARRP